jgi:predicted outer membrane repeat protein
MYSSGGTPSISDCSFTGNAATGDDTDPPRGGAMVVFEADATITGCSFTNNSVATAGLGGAVRIANAAPAFADCHFQANHAGDNADSGGGGAIDIAFDAAPSFHRCTFLGNTCTGSGGAISSAGTPSFIACTFKDNLATEDGGGLLAGGMATMDRCIIRGNHAQVNGGGIRFGFNGDLTMVNCLVADNIADGDGAGVYISAADIFPINCSFVGNSASGLGGGMYVRLSFFPVDNCLFWANDDSEGAAEASQIRRDSSEPTLRYCCVQGGWSGQGANNIDADPLFVDPGAGDYRLGPGSSCIDAADNAALGDEVIADLIFNPRFVDDPDTVDTGSGDPPIVDIGAYEFNACPADVNADGVVDVTDLLTVLGAWGAPGGLADVNDDGIIDVEDLLEVLSAWGACA